MTLIATSNLGLKTYVLKTNIDFENDKIEFERKMFFSLFVYLVLSSRNKYMEIEMKTKS